MRSFLVVFLVGLGMQGWADEPLRLVGSDAFRNLVIRWDQGFGDAEIRAVYRDSAEGPRGLIEGVADIGLMDRELTAAERAWLAKKLGGEPVVIPVAVSGLAVYVSAGNPIEGLTLAQLEAVFGAEPKRGADTAKTWGDLGLAKDWGEREITVYGRSKGSPQWLLFQERVLGGGAYAEGVTVLPSASSVLQTVITDAGGIGYARIGDQVKGVWIVPLRDEAGDGDFIVPTAETCLSGAYPLAQPLYVVVPPAAKRSAAADAFVRYVLSEQGQKAVTESRLLALPPMAAETARDQLREGQ